jgi:hypothetical protein
MLEMYLKTYTILFFIFRVVEFVDVLADPFRLTRGPAAVRGP